MIIIVPFVPLFVPYKMIFIASYVITEQTTCILSHYLLFPGFSFFSEVHFGGTYYKTVKLNCAYCKTIVEGIVHYFAQHLR